MLEKLIRKLYYSLFLVTPLLVFSSTSELFEFNKIMFIYLISMVIFFLWSVKSIRQRKVTLSKTRFDIFILLFVLSQVLSAVFSIDRHTSFFGYYGRFNGGLLSLISYVFLYFGFITFFKRNDIEKLLKLSLVSSVLVILWGLPGRFGFDLSCFVFSGELNNSCWTEQFKPAERMFSTIGQPNWLGAYLAVNFFIGLYFYIRRISRRGMHELLSGAYLLVNFIAILFSRSRSALLAVFVGLIFFATLSYLSFKKKHTLLSTGKRFAFLLFLLLSAVVVFKTGIAGIDRYLTISPITLRQAQGDGERRDVRRPKVETIKYQVSNASSKAADATESFDIRKIVWKGAIDLGLRYPLFGSGVETFAYSYYFVRPKEHNLTSEWDYLYNKAHNEFLNYFATTGFIGLGTYMLMIGIVLIAFFSKIKRSREIKNSEAEILTVALVSAYIVILITNFFGFSTTTINLFFYTIPGLFIILHNEKKATHFRYEEQVFKNNKIVLAINSIIIVALSVFLITYYVADLQYAQANLYSQTEDYQTAASLLQKSLRLHYEHVYQDKLSYALSNVAFFAEYQNERKTAENLVRLADFHNQQSIKSSPKNVLYWKTRAKNQYLFYQITQKRKNLEEAVAALRQAQKLSPTDPKIPHSLAVFYSLLEDVEGDKDRKVGYASLALFHADASIALKPDYREAYFLKAQLLKKAGREDEAKKTFQYILEKLNPRDEEVKQELQNL